MQEPISIRSPTETVMPDCCNIGVVFRALLAVNVACLAAILLQTAGWRAGLSRFVEASTLIEAASLSSLMALCGVRRLGQRLAPWSQRLSCTLVPAAVTALFVHALATNMLLSERFGDLRPVEGALVAALFGAALQHYFELRARAYSPALVEARLQALQARIRPHFLFNSLNAVLSLIRTEPKRAEATLEDLADLYRVFMRDARDMTTLEQEIRLCRQYLSIEQVRLGERLQVRWITGEISEEALRQAQIPSLLLQPLLENAVHYGVEPLPQPAFVRIEISRQIDRIEIIVTNPYDDHATVSQGNHLALDNIRQRLALLYDVEAQLNTLAADGTFEVRLRFPFIKAAKEPR